MAAPSGSSAGSGYVAVGTGPATEELHYTAVGDIPEIVAGARASFRTGVTRPLDWRRGQLKALLRGVQEMERQLVEAVNKDLHRPEFETIAGELGRLTGEIKFNLENMSSWCAPRSVGTPLPQRPGGSYVVPEPLGVVLIIAPWNFPILLCLGGLINALCAGNCVILKPSELAPACAIALEDLIRRYLDPRCVRVVQGAVAETTCVLQQRFDHILYTGGGPIAKIVLRAAAEHLTPTTLELGGKCPAVVDATANIAVTARRIVSGKAFNAGQVCLAVDYVLVQRSVQQQLVNAVREEMGKWVGAQTWKTTNDYGRIINARHFKRIKHLFDTSGGDVVTGGAFDESELFIEPTVLQNVRADAPIMQEEIFGPLLPIVPFETLEEAAEYINGKEKPLAMYIFSSNSDHQQYLLSHTSSGAVTVNDIFLHIANPCLPFGGVGASGMGAYFGKAGFETFSHLRAVLYKPTWFDPPVRYAPYTPGKLRALKIVMNGMEVPLGVKVAGVVVVAAAAGILLKSFL